MNSDDDVQIMYEQQPEDYYEKESKLNRRKSRQI